MSTIEKILGIDFGTSCTVFALANAAANAEPEIVEIDRRPCVETIMRLDDDGDIEMFGVEAWERADDAPERTFCEFKMGIGRKTSRKDPSGRVSDQDLAEIFLRRMREKIENEHFCGASLEQQNMLCVIGYPAEWTEKQRVATINAARAAGFPNVHGCEEPVGAIYFHDSRQELCVDSEQHMLVYDFGGGTSDVAVVRTVPEGDPRVLGVGGAVNLGGRDFDEAVLGLLLQQCGLDMEHLTPGDRVALRRAARKLKEKLAEAAQDGRTQVESTIRLQSLRAHKRLCLSRDDFECCCKPLMERFEDPVWQAMNRADVDPDMVKVSILAGGSAGMHYVRQALDDLFPNDIVLQSANPGEVVAKGLAFFGLSRALERRRPKTARPQSETPPSSDDSSDSGEHATPGPDPKRPATEKEIHAMPLAELMARAEAGEALAQNHLGDRYYEGDGVPESQQRAVEWYRKAAEQGLAEAQCNLGFMYLNGEGVHESASEAFTWFMKAAEQGNADAQYMIGRSYQEGWGCSQSDHNAFEWFMKAAIQGDADAQCNLGFMYLNGKGVHESASEAFAWFMKAAEQGHASAQCMVGRSYQEGWSGTQSDHNAFEWFMKAAIQGDADAQSMTGIMYLNGDGVHESASEAFAWFMKAAEQGNADAQYMVGRLYMEGWGVTKSDHNAFDWFMKAAMQGVADAQYMTGIMYLKGDGVHESASEAFAWFMKAAEQGHASAQCMVGRSYQEGWGVTKSDHNAFDWFMKAAMQVMVPRLYMEGWGVTPSAYKAAEWFYKAAEQGHTIAQYNLAEIVKDTQYVEAYRWYYISMRLGIPESLAGITELTKEGFFSSPKVSKKDQTRIQNEAEQLMREKGWL